ncbi:PAS domain S-box protein [Paenibacillus sp. S-38]|uniref:PAS domain-containing protein n=1 Tax=Paenibacillus sp. S-38 TaxID=3416710 RepID=UPI003CECA8BD
MEMHSLFERVFTKLSSGAALLTGDGKFVRANRAFCALVGYSEDELRDRSEAELTAREDTAEGCKPGGGNQCSLVQPFAGEKRYVHRLGYEICLDVHFTLLAEASESSEAVYLLEACEAKAPAGSASPPASASELYHLISGYSRDIIAYGANGILEYVSPASLHRLLGYESEEILGLHASELVHPDDYRRLRDEQLRESALVTCRLRHKKGRYVPFEVAVKRMHAGMDGLHKDVYIGRDITESERVQRALRTSERRLAQTQEMARIGGWEGDLAAGEVCLSPELLRILDQPASYRPSFRALLRLLHREDRSHAAAFLRKTRRGEALYFEGRLLNPDGSVKYIRVQGTATAGEEGCPPRLQGTVQDVSGQKLMLQMLEESVDRYISLKHYNLDGIVSINVSGIITAANPAAERITGYSTLELIGMHFNDLLHESERERAQSVFHRIMNSETLAANEIRALHRTGRILHLLVTPAPIFVNRKQVGCYILAKDITEQKRKDELLLKSEKLSIAGQLAAGVAHEIRNPLTALKGFVQLMSRGSSSASLYLGIMAEELERIESIISELLMLAKPQALEMKNCDLGTLVQEVALLLGTQASLQNIVIDLRRPAGTGIRICCNANQIKQVFINLLKNAMEAMPLGGVIRVEVEEPGEPSGFPLVRIIDQGGGIAEEQLRVVGEPFYSTKEAGTGLGLMVSHKIVEHHGGRICITSEMGVGTSIEVMLPAAGT